MVNSNLRNIFRLCLRCDSFYFRQLRVLFAESCLVRGAISLLQTVQNLGPKTYIKLDIGLR
jgi:hypothetical protein